MGRWSRVPPRARLRLVLRRTCTAGLATIVVWVFAIWAFNPTEDQRPTLHVRPAAARASHSSPLAEATPPTTEARPRSATAGRGDAAPKQTPGSIDFGSEATQRPVVVVNHSRAAIPWSATTSIPALSVVPARGSLAAGERVRVMLVLKRSAGGGGRLAAQVHIRSGEDRRTLAVAAIESPVE